MFRISFQLFLALPLLIALASSELAAQANLQKPQGGGVLDKTGTLSPADIAHLNDLCGEVKTKAGAEMVIVVVATTNGQNYKTYAENLFNRWGVGSVLDDNGIMVFVAKNDRTAQIVLGSGIDSQGQNQMVQQIFDREMVPKFRAGEYSEGIYLAAYQSAEQILRLQNLDAPRELPKVALRIPNTGRPNANNEEELNPLKDTDSNDLIRPNSIPNKRLPNTARPRNNIDDFQGGGLAGKEKQRKKNPLLWFLGGGMGLGGVSLIGGRYVMRFRKRHCPKCRHAMVQLDEVVDDEYLEREEILEENLGSVNYDVWACLTCEDVIKLRFGAFLTRFSSCPTCSRVTKSQIKQTLIPATKRRGGLVQVTERCENCSYHNQYTYRTPRLPDIKASTGGGGFGGGRGGRSRRSSGGGGGSRGGRTRGGGGGGRW